MRAMARNEKKSDWSSEQIVDLYAGLLKEIWEIGSALIGEAILQLLLTLTIRKMRERHPFLASLEVSEGGVAVNGLREKCRETPAIEIHRGFQGLITHLFDLFSALAEGVVSRELFPKVFPKVKEAERLFSRK